MDFEIALSRCYFNEDFTDFNKKFVFSKRLDAILKGLFQNHKNYENFIEKYFELCKKILSKFDLDEAKDVLFKYFEEKINPILNEFFKDGKVYYTDIYKYFHPDIECETEIITLEDFKKELCNELFTNGMITRKYEEYLAENIHNNLKEYADKLIGRINKSLCEFKCKSFDVENLLILAFFTIDGR